ncbi:MAG TPA: hypothetical protein VF735_22220 [Pyrinomonadaceae bacterium]|jgi:predicted TIM-barrel fold metal-dependent hydrolase
MNRYQLKLSLARVAFFTLAPVGLLLSLATGALAQRGAGSSVNMDRARESGVREHQQQLNVLLNSKEPGHTGEERRLQAIIEQTKQDFDRIQVLNRELINTASAEAAASLDYKSLTDMASEIRKRARRLKDNISLPPSDDAQETLEKRAGEISREEMKGALLTLSKRIVSFTTNPLFQTTNVIDARLGAKASRDLDVIVELSAQIKKSAEKLGKSSQ